MHFQDHVTGPNALLVSKQQSAPEPEENYIADQGAQGVNNSMNDFNAIAALQNSMNEDAQ